MYFVYEPRSLRRIAIMGKKSKISSAINSENIRDIASDAIYDITYSVLTDVMTRLEKEDLINDVPKAIEIIDETTRNIGLDGIRLRRANIERRTNARGSTKGGNSGSSKASSSAVSTSSVAWIVHPKDKKLEYTKDMEIGRRYILRKMGTNKVVGLLSKTSIGDKKLSYGLKDEKTYTISSADHLLLNTRGFTVEQSNGNKKKKKVEEEEESSEDDGESSDESDYDEEETVVRKKKKYHKQRK